MTISSSRRRYTHTGELLTIIIITQMILNDAVSEQHTHTHTHTHTHMVRNITRSERSPVFTVCFALSPWPLGRYEYGYEYEYEHLTNIRCPWKHPHSKRCLGARERKGHARARVFSRTRDQGHGLLSNSQCAREQTEQKLIFRYQWYWIHDAETQQTTTNTSDIIMSYPCEENRSCVNVNTITINCNIV